MRLGGEFQHYTASGEINVFGSGTVILVSDFGFADLNGDGKINDLDIPEAVRFKSSAPVVPVPFPRCSTAMLPGICRTIGAALPRLTLNLGLRWEYDSEPHRELQRTRSLPQPYHAADSSMHLDGERNRLEEDSRKKDFGPRVGFVYDLSHNGSTVLRGGYGIYYDRIILESGAEELVQNDRALTVSAYGGSVCTRLMCPVRRVLTHASHRGAALRSAVRPSRIHLAARIKQAASASWPWGRMHTIRRFSNFHWAATAGRQLADVGRRAARICESPDHRPSAAEIELDVALCELPRRTTSPAHSPTRSVASPTTSRFCSRRGNPGTTALWSAPSIANPDLAGSPINTTSATRFQRRLIIRMTISWPMAMPTSRWTWWKGSDNFGWRRATAVTDERHRLTLYGGESCPGDIVCADLYLRVGRGRGHVSAGDGQYQRIERLAIAVVAEECVGREIRTATS